MEKFLLGKKLGMTQVMDDDGVVVPVTVLEVKSCTVLKVLTKETHGYNAILIGFEEVQNKTLNSPNRGFFAKLESKPFRYLKEFRVEDVSSFSAQQIITPDIFSINDTISVRSKSIGRGFTGTIKRHNFSRGPMSHGSKSHRIPGSIGAGTTPGRVVKGKKMPGHYGDSTVTIRNLRVVRTNLESGYILVEGAVPGKKNNLVEIVGS
ncbi:MAG: 50S ribosomal protein L3 [Candidatus Margulisbacteria bacterium]|nr:50S ribosomal protein L3 [Candidatus Margulisiibacteriota bacterium]